MVCVMENIEESRDEVTNVIKFVYDDYYHRRVEKTRVTQDRRKPHNIRNMNK